MIAYDFMIPFNMLHQTNNNSKYQVVCLLVRLESLTAFVPRGQLIREDLRRAPLTTPVTRQPRALTPYVLLIPLNYRDLPYHPGHSSPPGLDSLCAPYSP